MSTAKERPSTVDRLATAALVASIDANLKASIVGNVAAAAMRHFSPAFADTLHLLCDGRTGFWIAAGIENSI